MTPPLPPLAYLPDYPSLGESLLFQLNGLIVVLLALCSIWATLELIGLYFKAAARRGAARTPASVPTPSPASPETVLAGELVAVIAAAVHTTVGPAHRICSVKPADASADWAREGRRQIFASHRLR